MLAISKFEPNNKCKEVDGCVDASVIADKFAQHFSNCYTCNNVEQGKTLMNEYRKLRENYFRLALPDTIDVDFDTELVSNVILALNLGKLLTLTG